MAGALADFDRAIGINPRRASAHSARGWVKFLRDDFAGGAADAGHAIQLDSGYPNAYETRGWARYGLGDVAGAVEDFKKAAALFKPDSAGVLLDRGMLGFIAGDYGRAISSWERAFSKDATLGRELHSWMERAKANVEAKAQAEEWAARGSKSPHLRY